MKTSADGQQQLLLGAGLTLATIALLATLTISGYLVFRPAADSQPKIKQVEDGKGGRFIVVGK